VQNVLKQFKAEGGGNKFDKILKLLKDK
jgi:hypothetical protein